jgi:hypothetical protein
MPSLQRTGMIHAHIFRLIPLSFHTMTAREFSRAHGVAFRRPAVFAEVKRR